MGVHRPRGDAEGCRHRQGLLSKATLLDPSGTPYCPSPLMLLTVQLTGSFTSITVVVSSPSPFFSQKLNDAEINYSTFYRELLAVTTSSSTPLKGGG